jgi:hypothetical protein
VLPSVVQLVSMHLDINLFSTPFSATDPFPKSTKFHAAFAPGFETDANLVYFDAMH